MFLETELLPDTSLVTESQWEDHRKFVEKRKHHDVKDDAKWEVHHKKEMMDENLHLSNHMISMSTAYRYPIKLGWISVKLKRGIFMGEDLKYRQSRSMMSYFGAVDVHDDELTVEQRRRMISLIEERQKVGVFYRDPTDVDITEGMAVSIKERKTFIVYHDEVPVIVHVQT